MLEGAINESGDYSADPLMIESEPEIINKAAHNFKRKIQFNLWMFASIFMFGTKMLWIGVSNLDETWTFFFEHFSIWTSGAIIYWLIRRSPKYDKSAADKIIFKRDFLICSIIGGICLALGNFCIIFAIHFCLSSGISPAAMNCLIMSNIVLLIFVGVYFFDEKHTYMEYIGSVIIITGLIWISFQRTIGEFSNSFNDTDFYLGIVLTLAWSFMWASSAIIGKYISLLYCTLMGELSFLTMISSGIFGSLFIIYILIGEVSMNPKDDGNTLLYIFVSNWSGVFTMIGVYWFMRALQYGSVGIAFMLVNIQLIVEMIEEFIVFHIIPSILGGIGMILAILGASIVVIYQHPETISY